MDYEPKLYTLFVVYRCVQGTGFGVKRKMTIWHDHRGPRARLMSTHCGLEASNYTEKILLS